MNTIKELQGTEKLLKYIDEYLNSVNLEENDQNSFNYELVNKLVDQMITLIKKNEDEEAVLKERFYIKRIFKQLKSAKKLEKRPTPPLAASAANSATMFDMIK